MGKVPMDIPADEIQKKAENHQGKLVISQDMLYPLQAVQGAQMVIVKNGTQISA